MLNVRWRGEEIFRISLEQGLSSASCIESCRMEGMKYLRPSYEVTDGGGLIGTARRKCSRRSARDCGVRLIPSQSSSYKL